MSATTDETTKDQEPGNRKNKIEQDGLDETDFVVNGNDERGVGVQNIVHAKRKERKGKDAVGNQKEKP